MPLSEVDAIPLWESVSLAKGLSFFHSVSVSILRFFEITFLRTLNSQRHNEVRVEQYS